MSLPSPRLTLRHPACWLWVLLLNWFMGGMLPTASGSPRPDGGQFDSRRATTLKYNLSNGRGDIVAQTDGGGSLSWTASYEAYGKRTKESGANADKQRANSKDEDPTGLLNEGFRYRDLETGGWMSRDPAGFVDGPNLYAYVMQNPWSKFDAEGLWAEDLALGIPSLGVGIASLASNIKKGHVGAAIWDGVGIVADAAAVLLPGVPGGVGLGTKAARLAAAQNKVENAIDTAETVVEAGAAVATGDATALVDVAIDKAMDRAMGGKKSKGGDPPGPKSQKRTNAESQEIAANSGGSGAVQAGQAGEAVSGQLTGMPKNTVRIPSASGKKAYRVPDHMDATQRHITETKNVDYQYYSSQLKEDKAHVLRAGGAGRVDVMIDQRTTISPQLLREHLNPGSPIKLRSENLKD